MDIEQSSNMKKISLDDFYLLTVIGKGAYAKVILVKTKIEEKIYALKIIKKKKIEKQRQIDHIFNEKNILIQVEHPFIVKLQHTFQNETKLFFVIEYCHGGELFTLLQKNKRFNEETSLFYTAQIILALNHLHENSILYRDLKPENVLIDLKGYIKLTDFGLSKIGVKNGRDANSVCGTPEYLAPEILFRSGHGKQVDWWTLGCILFEMIAGYPPFQCTNRKELFEQIKYGVVVYPKYFSESVKSLLDGLFIKNPEKRFGFNQTKNHIWFSRMNWDLLLNKQIIPPFKPIVDFNEDPRNFEKEFVDLPINSLSEQDQSSVNLQYDDFSYSRTQIQENINSYN